MKLEGEKSGRRHLIVIAAIAVAAFLAFKYLVPDIDVEQLLEDLSEKLGDWTYALVGVLAFLETGAFVGLVFPGETAVILGGAVAGQGETSIVITIAIVWFCAWAGDTTSFWIGTRLGRDFVLRHGPKVRITHERFEQVEAYFGRHGGKTILIGRFIGLVRALAPFIAGSSGMRYRAFVPYSVLGTGLWAAAFSLLGYALANSIDRATELAGTGALVFGSLVAVVVAVVVVSRYLRKPENREQVAERLASMPGVRRVLPQLRFAWRRITPGGLGLEFTSLLAVLAVSLFVLIGYALIVTDNAGPTPGDAEAIDVVNKLRIGLAHRRGGGGQRARRDGGADPAGRDRRGGARRAWPLGGARGADRGDRDHPHRRPGAEGDHRPAAPAGRAGERGEPELSQRPRGALGVLRLARAHGGDPGPARVDLRDGADDRRPGAHRGDRAQPRLPRRPLPERRERRVGAGGGGVRRLRGDRHGRHPLTAESSRLMPIVAKIGTEYLLFGAAGLISVLAFAALILAPAIGSFGRTWEKATAVLVSIFVLAALLAIGVALGIAIVYYWDDITHLFD